MKLRTSKQIKLTEEEFDAFNTNAFNLQQTLQTYTDAVVIDYIEENKKVEDIQFLTPKKSAAYRSLWISPNVAEFLRTFARNKDTSQNSVLYTAIKSRISQYPEPFPV